MKKGDKEINGLKLYKWKKKKEKGKNNNLLSSNKGAGPKDEKENRKEDILKTQMTQGSGMRDLFVQMASPSSVWERFLLFHRFESR